MIIQNGSDIILKNEYFDIEKSLNCGQCFNYTQNGNEFTIIAMGKVLNIEAEGEKTIFKNVSKTEFENIWMDYFDLNRDYSEVYSNAKDDLLKEAIRFGHGIRVFNQDPFETLISFIISSNNNIPRIKKIIKLLCENFGDRVCLKGDEYYLFPTPCQLKDKTVEDLSVIRAGFRVKYIVDAVSKINNKEIDLDALKGMDTKEAKAELMKIKGVGSKVADCILLFSLNKTEVFPKDVWTSRILLSLYPQLNGDTSYFGEYGGIYQQFLYNFAIKKGLVL